MPKGYCYIPRTQTEWEYDVEDEVDLIEQVKYVEEVKRIPSTWRLVIIRDGKRIEVNRSAAARKKAEKKKGLTQ